jgi:tetratricopeptide (TPR) repeat protein
MRQRASKSKRALMKAASPVMARPAFPVWLIGVVLVLVTIAVYWPATNHDFVNYDDDMYVLENPHVTTGLSLENAWWTLRSGYAGNWHPVTWLSHMLDWEMFSLNPWGHHLTNVLLHAINAGLVFALLQQMTGAAWRSLLVAVLFAVHPLRVESVAWVSERKDVLSGFFGLLALMAYARYAEGRRNKAEGRSQKQLAGAPWSELGDLRSLSHLPFSFCYLLSLLLFVLGLMSKPMLVTWPLVMLLLDYWPLRRLESSTSNTPLSTMWRLVREKVPFLVLAALASVVTFVVQKRGGAMTVSGSLSLGSRVGNALISYSRYLGKLFWPTDLAVYYPHPWQWPLGQVVLAGGLILVISVLIWVQRRRTPYSLVGWLWFLGTLVPVIGLVQVGEQAMADRYTYLPSLGVLVLGVWSVCELTRSWRHRVVALTLAGCGASVVCLALTLQQLGHWRDGESLFRHAIEVTENNYIAHKTLGDALDKKGQTAEAIHHYQEAIRLAPDYALAYYNLGLTLGKGGQIDEAIHYYREAIRFKPDYADAHNNLGDALLMKGQVDEAIRQYQEAVRLKPDYAMAHYNLGLAFGMEGQIDEAIRQYEETIRLRPGYADAHNNLGGDLSKKGRIDEAILQYHEAIRLKPDYVMARYNLGVLLGKTGQTGEAISQLQEVIRLKPDSAGAYNYLGTALCNQGRTGEAIRQFQEALRLKPDYTDARKNLDAALAAKGESLPPP